MTNWQITLTSQNLPPSLLGIHREQNLLWYGSSELFVAQEGGKEGILGAIRVALRDHPTVKHGLITDLQITPENFGDSEALFQDLIKKAEEYLLEQGVTKIDALVLDGQKLTEPYLKAGYWASRKTVVLEWDLDQVEMPESVTELDIQLTDQFDIDEITDFILNSYQPYYQWWKDDMYDRIWERIDYPAEAPDEIEQKNLAENQKRIVEMLKQFNQKVPQRWVMARKNGKLVALCDVKIMDNENFDWGILITRDHPGKGVAKNMLLTALHWLKSEGQQIASVTTTSGMDDFDPTVYLYTLSGAKILGEFLNLVKRNLEEITS